MVDIFHTAMMTEYKLTTLKDMTPEEAERAQRDAEYWASERLATRTFCNRCRLPYEESNPNCINFKIHGKEK